jgi:hypothetical protein
MKYCHSAFWSKQSLRYFLTKHLEVFLFIVFLSLSEVSAILYRLLKWTSDTLQSFTVVPLWHWDWLELQRFQKVKFVNFNVLDFCTIALMIFNMNFKLFFDSLVWRISSHLFILFRHHIRACLKLKLNWQCYFFSENTSIF